MTQTPSQALRSRWLAALLPHVAFDGWTEAAAAAAASEAGLNEGEQALAAPHGVIDLIEAFFDAAEAEARGKLAAEDLSGLRVHERVKHGLLAWLAVLEPNREAVRRAASRGFLPWSAGTAMQRAWSVADMVWTAAGDTATDYNRYSKRGLLASVIPPIVMYWVDSPEAADLDAYVTRRLKQASGVGQTAGKVVTPVLDLLKTVRNGAKDSPFGR
ncbi:COQ9 family protein [Hyphomonas johnsonii]|uniref:RpsU-divergently transcribed protein n=1 Tax=Hyphomonas johnsonii MHS-2 TaxID=1280950 RepID=A0A059FPA3_9PROT|nr:COQ9 family protein [Hyphomonas johnsonii]KCZ92447.1 rpsU-divergently transcribed protein [Hyphomonas johnsonii MHS-2]